MSMKLTIHLHLMGREECTELYFLAPYTPSGQVA
jgi:hypothetical protein